jgi:uncharacterized OB-fold protein
MKTRCWEKDPSLLAFEEISHMPFKWAMGLDSSKFFQEIKERETLLGIKCHQCHRVYVPPRRVCGPCFVKIDELVELGCEGVVQAVTLVNYPFIDPDTGEQRPIPYIYGYVQLDGADNLFSHIIRTPPGMEVKVGDRVRAIFEKLKQGRIQDIAYFEPIKRP